MSFFKNVTSISRTRDSIIKKTLIDKLSECVKEIQYNQYEDNFQTLLSIDETTNTLCMTLEAIFLHGLKDTFLRKAKNALSGDPDYKPQPSFWPLVLVLSHRQNIDDISSLPQIISEIGQCRAWLRLALNECLLSSYLATLLKNISTIKAFYYKSAFVCDAEILEISTKLVEGLETCVQFKIPVNSSLLNSWPEQVLMLAGMWTTRARVTPVISAGVDIASMLASDDNNVTTPTKTEYNISSLNSLVINEDDAFKLILSNDSNKQLPTPLATPTDGDNENVLDSAVDTNITPSTSHATSPTEIINDDIVEVELTNVMGNSLIGKTCWSSEINDELTSSVTSHSSHGSSMIKTPETKSVSSLIDHTNTYGAAYATTPNLRDIIKQIQEDLKPNPESNNEVSQLIKAPTSPEDPALSGLDFEVISSTVSHAFTVEELQKFICHLGTLSREQGLDSQNYKCKKCQDPLGSSISKAQVCAFTGEYFCTKCMDPNVFMIPSRVIHNFDFKRYPVSKRAALFLLEFQDYPWIDMKKLNPKIYQGVAEMAQLQELRIQLNFLRAYIFTCREPIIEELQKRVWPREYLYDHVHQYTIADLAQIPTGSLSLQLEKVVSFAKSHVLECWLCSQKGFICEVCRDTKILYPFDTSTTYRCENCSSVFHSTCQSAFTPCPKCQRKQNRCNASLVDAVHNHFK